MPENTPKGAIELCLAVYRITDKFPREEVLGHRLRVVSLDITDWLVYNRVIPTSSSRFFNWEDLEQKIRVLFTYFAVAEKQGWVGKNNFVLLRDEYRKLYVESVNKSLSSAVKQENTKETTRQARLPARQEKILRFLKDNREGETISNIAKVIEASNKTAERDLKNLISAGRVEKRGNTKGARFISITDK